MQQNTNENTNSPEIFQKSVQCVLFKPLINKHGLLLPLMLLDIAIIFFFSVQSRKIPMMFWKIGFPLLFIIILLECSDQPSNNT